MSSLVKSLIYSNAIKNAQIAVFDDGSDKTQLTIINNYEFKRIKRAGKGALFIS